MKSEIINVDSFFILPPFVNKSALTKMRGPTKPYQMALLKFNPGICIGNNPLGCALPEMMSKYT